MIHYHQGNVFEHLPEAYVFVHGCNAQRTMGSGVAKVIKERYPEVYYEYLCMPPRLGEVSSVQLGDCVFFNAITQQYYGRDSSKVYVDYHYTELALEKVAEFAKANNLPVYMPFIGGGLGGGDRKLLHQIFKRVFEEVEVHIFTLESMFSSA